MKKRFLLVLFLVGIIVAGMIISRRIEPPTAPDGGPAPVATAITPAGGPAPVHVSSTAPKNPSATEDFAAPAPDEVAETNITNANTNGVPDDLETRMALMAHLRDWASTNFDAALTWVQQMPEGDERDEAMQALCYGLAQKDPALAVAKAQTLQQPESVMENLVQQWAGKDLTSSLVWAESQPSGDDRDQLFQRIGFVLSETDPRDAAGLVMEQIPPGAAQNEAIMSVLHQWANQDMVAAVDWVKTFPESPFRERALQELEGINTYKKGLANQ